MKAEIIFLPTSQVSENLGKLYSEMIFVHGFVHCDPHPGNILVQRCPSSQKSQIVLLDHGLYQVQNLQASSTKKIPFVAKLQTIFHAAVWGFEPTQSNTHNKAQTRTRHISAGLQQDKSFLINKPFDAGCSIRSVNCCISP